MKLEDFLYDPSLVLYLPLWKRDKGATTYTLSNPGFEDGDPPTSWSLTGAGATVAQSTVQVQSGTYSALLTRNGAGCTLLQTLSNPSSYSGFTLTVSAWVYATVASRAMISIGDNAGDTNSSYHSGTPGWEYLTASRTITGSATSVAVKANVITGDTAAYFDNFILTGAGSLFSEDAYGHVGGSSGALWTPQGFSFDGVDDVITLGTSAVLNNLTGNQTHMVWIKPTSAGENSSGRIFDKTGSTPRGLFFTVAPTALASFSIVVGTVTKSATSANNSVPLSAWSCVFGEFDGSNALIDTNGTLVTGAATAGPVDAHAADSFLIGDRSASNRCFDGLQGEIWSFSRAFSAIERQALRELTKFRYGVVA